MYLSILKLSFIIFILTFSLSNSQDNGNLFSCRSFRQGNFIPRVPKTYFNVRRNRQIIMSGNPNITVAPEDTSFVTVFVTRGRRNRCLGNIQSLEVCYNAASLTLTEELSLFLVDNDWMMSEESRTIVIVKPNVKNCVRIKSTGKSGWVCCETISGINLKVTQKHIGFGVTVLGNGIKPYRFDSSESTYFVRNYEWNVTDEAEFNSDDGNDGQLLLFRVFIDFTLTTTKPVTETERSTIKISENNTHLILSSTSSIPAVIASHEVSAIAGASVGALILLCLVIIIVILIVAVCFINKSRQQKRQLAVSMERYSKSQEEEAEYADIGPEICLKINSEVPFNGNSLKDNPYISTLGSNLANPYEVPNVSASLRTTDETCDLYTEPSFNEESIYAQLEDCGTNQICGENIKLEEILGSGQFGEVYKGMFLIGNDKKMEVAIKTLKKEASEEDRIKFLQEAAIMSQFKHPNVVTMYGVVSDYDFILIVLELLMKGDLRNHLRKLSSEEKLSDIDDHTLLSYCRQIACGMTYLSNKAFVHRDLAARNILVSDDEVCKIADFGMSRDLMYESYYVSHGGMIPVKWTAPEALYYKKYSTASDVWSYGVLMYEIWSLGQAPYQNIDNAKVMKHVENGNRLQPPPGCPRHIYSIMIDCWNFNSTERPSFMDIGRQLSLPDSKLLQWEKTDKLNAHVTNLGAQLEVSKDLYKDLQNRYQ